MIDINKICVVGAGNVGVAVAVDVANTTHKEVVLHTSKASRLANSFIKIDSDSHETRIANIKVTNDYEISLKNTDLVIVTVPTFVIQPIIENISRYNPKVILFVPGFGSKEFFCKRLIEKGCVIAGLARSPYVCRLENPQKVIASKKKELHVAMVNKVNKFGEIDVIISELFEIPVKKYPNYLVVAFTPSNPILHTARLYSMFRDYNFSTKLHRMIKFYGEWTDFSSEVLIKMDDELNQVIKKLSNIDLSCHVNLRDYYESHTAEEMTKKITAIQSWHNLDSPMIKENNYYFIDRTSRYFVEDFNYGLCNLKGFAEIVGVETPMMDTVLEWYQKISGIEFFNAEKEFKGVGLCKSGIPQNFGISTIDDIEKFYIGT